MTSRLCRVVAAMLPLVTSATVLRAQTVRHLEVGAAAGGSAFGWQPHPAVGGELLVAALGSMQASLHGSFARFGASSAARSEVAAGATLSSTLGYSSWWLGADAVRRTGLKDLVERPRISTGGWHRVGPLTIGVAASRRTAEWSAVRQSERRVVNYFLHQDSITGLWDSTRTVSTVTDSSQTRAVRRWAETQATLAWEAQRWSAELSVGGRVATRNVPGGAWAGAELAVRLARPLALVLGGGTASSSDFLLDAEHRYVTLGFRVRPFTSSGRSVARVPAPAGALAGMRVDAIEPGRYRLSLAAPHAHQVELSGDFTGWKPVRLTRDEHGRWAVTLALLPGAHRLNARIDGGAWIVPPGLPTMSDDFQGQVGVLVIEGERGPTPK